MRSDLPYMSPGPGPAHWTLLGKLSRGWPGRGRALRGLRDTQKNRVCCHTDRGRQRQLESAAGADLLEDISGGTACQRAAEKRAERGSRLGSLASLDVHLRGTFSVADAQPLIGTPLHT